MPKSSGRCEWCGEDPLYVAYHDEEWGVPKYDSKELWEALILDSFQAGLSWITILRKRENFRRAFRGFVPAKVARFGARDVKRLMADAGIVRNRGKIDAAIAGARAWLAIEEREGFSNFIWGFVDGKPIQNRFRRMADLPAATPLAERVAKALRAEGFRFVGPTSVYAFMQGSGLVNDHVVSCPRHRAVAAMGR